MSKDDIVKYQLLEEVLEKGLKVIADYVKQKTNHSLMISSPSGKIYYPDMPKGALSNADNRYIEIPEFDENQEYHFFEKKRILYFCVGGESICAYIIMNNMDINRYHEVLPKLRDVSLAVKCYFSNLKSIERVEKSLKYELLQDLLYNNNAHIREILKNSNQQKFDITQIYYIGIIEPETDISIDMLYSFSKEWLRRRNYDPICSIWMNSVILICPAHFKNHTLEVDSDWQRHYINIKQHKTDMEKKLNMKCSIGLGEKYPLMELHRSYNEAKTALNVARLMGERGFIKHFHDLGIFTLLYMHDSEILKDYCYKTLGKLIAHDRENGSELIPALRLLFDSNMNWKEAASSLFIHVNTLRYRMNKIEELLEIDLNTSQVQANLFIALNLYDSLIANGYI